MNLKDIEEKEIVPGYRAKFVHSDNMTQAHWDIDDGAILPEHSHPHEQVSTMQEGEFEITIDGESRVLKKDDFVIITKGDLRGKRGATNNMKIIQVGQALEHTL